METSRLQTKVGLFVFIGLALLAVLLIEFSKSTNIFHGTYELRLHAVNVGGLKLRASVLLSGVQVGTVSDIRLAEDGKSVTIVLKVYKECKIYHDARFVIESANFLGDQYVSVIPTANTPPVWTNDADVECQEPFNIQEVARSASGFIQRIDVTAQKLDASVSELQRVVLNGQTLTNFSVAVNNMQQFSQQALDTVSNINVLVATNALQVGIAISNVVFFSQKLTLMADSANGLLATNGVEITAAAKNIESSTETLKKLADDLQSGRGLAGTILQNGQLATNVQAVADNLAVATSNLNRFGLWHMMWHHEPPAANAPASSRNPH